MKLFTKSNCSTCLLVKEYLEMIQAKFDIVNIDTRIPADLIEAMNKPEFPEVFDYPILITEDKILFGKDILNFH